MLCSYINISSKNLCNIVKLQRCLKKLSMASQDKSIRNFAFLDLETTGLPFEEHNKTKITEINITIVDSNHLRLGTFPRVRNKLNLCLNPGKFISPASTEITGLSNDLLEHQSSFSVDVVNTISDFLNLHKEPICFVAHNGNQFDYPIMRAEIKKIEGEFFKGIMCIDSLLCFKDLHRKQELSRSISSSSTEVASEEVDSPISKRVKTSQEIPLEFTDDFDKFLCDAIDEYEESTKIQKIKKKNETTPVKQIKFMKPSEVYPLSQKFSTSNRRPRVSFKLEDIYERLTSKIPENSHHAEGDVECLIHCAAKYGEDFITWANENAKSFEDVPPMRPGIKIGF